MTTYRVYDVFTHQPFGGNQLAVIPDAQSLPEDQLQRIAREFNYSETTFVYPPDDPAHTARVRIFTPTMEIPFAGHPTIGTAICLSQKGRGDDLVLELGIGPIPCSVTGERARFATRQPLDILGHPPPALVARALGLTEDDVETSVHAPTLAGVGRPFVLVPLKSSEALAACQTDIGAFRDGAAQHPAALDFAIYAYVRSGNRVDARMFAPLDNIPEDAATGSAAAALTAFLHDHDGRNQQLEIHQGVTMGRPSVIHAESQDDPREVLIAGDAVLTMEGKLYA